ncbi:hypothetical protein PG988_011780 [Apiospora saccharicola]
MADAAADMDERGGSLDTVKDLFAGATGGIAQVLIGKARGSAGAVAFWELLWAGSLVRHHSEASSLQSEGFAQRHKPGDSGQPFDIVKVRLQTTTQYKSALDAATSIYTREGPKAFYKGTLTPLIGIGACVSIQFGAFGYAKRYFETANEAAGKKDLSYTQYYAAGAFAGLANSALSGPIEHVRIRLQTQPHGEGRLYSGPLDCVRKLTAHQGVLGGVYRGEAVTLMREAQAYGMWFMSFEWMMNAHAARNNIDRKDVPSYMVAWYGGLAGEALLARKLPL